MQNIKLLQSAYPFQVNSVGTVKLDKHEGSLQKPQHCPSHDFTTHKIQATIEEYTSEAVTFELENSPRKIYCGHSPGLKARMRVLVVLLHGKYAPTLRKIKTSVRIEGQEFQHVVEPEANLTQIVEWDGRDVSNILTALQKMIQ